MASGVALRAQIASVIDALSKAAVAEIAKVVEDGMVVLRLEMCQRENEIKKLKSNIEVLHGELRATQQAATLRPNPHHGGDGSQSCVGDGRNYLEKVHPEGGNVPPPLPDVRVKHEPVEEASGKAPRSSVKLGEDATLYEGGQWRPTSQNQTEGNNMDYMNLGQNSLQCLPESSLGNGTPSCSGGSAGLQQSPYRSGLLGYSQYRNTYNMVRRRTVKRLMFRKGFFCPYCGKCFDRIGHLERHKRIHTGEKPYHCEICGKRFSQKCTVKEHMKTHRRYIQTRPLTAEIGERKHVIEVNPGTNAPTVTQQETKAKTEGLPPQSEDPLPTTTVQVKSEPAEEKIPQPPFHPLKEQAREAADNPSDSFSTVQRDNQQWMSRLQNSHEMSGNDFLGGSAAQGVTSYPGIAQLLPPPPVEASCSSFNFPGKPYGELKNNMLAQAPYRPAEPLMMSSDASLHGMGESSMSHMHHTRNWGFQPVKPKKCFVCSYCSKIFERAGHLERHLRIHTGEKPYGCHICGRCFNQKSSLKGHMKTHRNGETTDMLDAHHLMFTLSDNQLENLGVPNNQLAASEEHLPGPAYGEAIREESLAIKLEPDKDGFQTSSRLGSDLGMGGLDPSQMWTEKSNDASEQGVCVILPDVKYHISPGASNEQMGYVSPNKDLSFIDKEKDELMRKDPYSVMGVQPALASEPHDPNAIHEVVVNDYGATPQGSVYDFNITGAGNLEDNCGADASMPNSFICANCGQSFDSFNMFQAHQCESAPDQSLGCKICGKTFSQMSILKLHLKLHAEKNLL